MLTLEQDAVVRCVRGGRHCSVVALPGSGKSTLAYGLIDACTEDPVTLLLMYNRSLNDKTNAHIESMSLKPRRARSFTFHGLLSSLSGQTCHDDQQVARIVSTLETCIPQPKEWEWSNFTVLIIDESQDIRPDMLRIIHFLITNVCCCRDKLRLVFLGDPRQLLYNFYARDRADDRFLTESRELFKHTNTLGWEAVELTRSFRSTPPVADFMNLLIPSHNMQPRDEENSRSVQLIICDVYRDPQWLILSIVKTWDPEEVMILCPSLNERSPARSIVDKLVQQRVPIHVARSGGLSDTSPHTSSGLSPERGKIRVKTFCSAKGLEANLVVVVNPRGLFGKNMDNALYVALTRSVKKLVIFQSSESVTWDDLESLTAHLPNKTSLHIDVHRPLLAFPAPMENDPRPQTYLAAESMFHYVDPRCLEKLVEALKVSTVRGSLIVSHPEEEGEDGYARSMEVVTVDGLAVNVRRLTGSALVLAAEYYGRDNKLPDAVVQLSSRVQTLVQEGLSLLNDKSPTYSLRHQRWCHLQAFQRFAIAIDVDTGYSDKAIELEGHAFALSTYVFRRLDLLLDDVATYVGDENTCRWYTRLSKKHGKLRLSGRPTLVVKDHLFLIFDRPTTTSLTDLAEIGMYLSLSDREVAFVSNVHTGELIRVDLSFGQQEDFLTRAIDSKLNREETPCDEDFLKRFQLPGNNCC